VLKLGWAITAAIGLHVGALIGAGWWAPGVEPTRGIQGASGAALQVRWVAPQHAPIAAKEVPATPEVAREPETTPEPIPEPVPPPQASSQTTPPSANEQDIYLPRSALTRGPKPLAPVIVAYPAGIQSAGAKVSLILALFIDENGHVRRTEPEGERMEPAFEQAANDAFLQAHFEPGELNGQSVKARILVEVSFETSELPVATATNTRPTRQ
jgi:outer membrane biosynthesis protein TonB